MLDVSGTLHVFLFKDVAFPSNLFFSYHIELLALLLSLNVYLLAVHCTGIHDVGGLTLAQKGKRPRNQKEGPRKAGLEGSISLHTLKQDGSGFEDEFSLQKSHFPPPYFLEEE